MAFVDGYGVKGKFTAKTGKKAAQQKAKKAEAFRAQEKSYLTKSIGTAGPKPSVDMSSGGDDDKPKEIKSVDMGDKDSGVVIKSKAPLQKPAGIDKENTFIESVQMGDKDSSPQTIAPLKQSEILEPNYTFLEEKEVFRTGRSAEIKRRTGEGLLTLSLKPSVNLFDRSKTLFDGMEIKGEVIF